MSPLQAAMANDLRVKLGRGRDLPEEAKPKRTPRAKPPVDEGGVARGPQGEDGRGRDGAESSSQESRHDRAPGDGASRAGRGDQARGHALPSYRGPCAGGGARACARAGSFRDCGDDASGAFRRSSATTTGDTGTPGTSGRPTGAHGAPSDTSARAHRYAASCRAARRGRSGSASRGAPACRADSSGAPGGAACSFAARCSRRPAAPCRRGTRGTGRAPEGRGQARASHARAEARPA